MGGGHAHGHDEPFYLHAKHMYNLDRMKYQKIKMPLAVFTAFSIGVIVPVYAVIFQQKKTASGWVVIFQSFFCNNGNKFVLPGLWIVDIGSSWQFSN